MKHVGSLFYKEGKYLYFTASTDAALSNAWLDMSSIQRPVTRSVYLVVLAKDAASPLAPESDEEKPTAPEAKKPDDAASKGVPDKKDVAVRIDLENISQRILALPIPARNYTSMSAGKTGALFLVESPMVSALTGTPEGATLQMFDLKTRKTDKIREGIASFALSVDGEKMLYRQGEQYFIAVAGKAPATPPAAGTGGPLKLDTMEVWVDPRAEWAHMYHQVWRDERDFFYPRRDKCRASKNRWHVPCGGSPHKRGCCPLVHPPLRFTFPVTPTRFAPRQCDVVYRRGSKFNLAETTPAR